MSTKCHKNFAPGLNQSSGCRNICIGHILFDSSKPAHLKNKIYENLRVEKKKKNHECYQLGNFQRKTLVPFKSSKMIKKAVTASPNLVVEMAQSNLT